jgi:hypothetical protein
MPKKPHLFERLSETERLSAMRAACKVVFGQAKGEQIWKGMEPALTWKGRQLGDALAPEENFWKGAWRIYEAE